MIQQITEIDLLGVWDRGVPNTERVVMQCHAGVELGDYCLVCGPPSPTGGIHPSPHHFYKFPFILVAPGSWIVLYTGRGQQFVAPMAGTNQPVHALYWGRDFTIFSDPAWSPALLRISGIGLSQT